ncbi:MAG: hypothetical protein WC485_11045, partial [Opitutaceae bacterium]
IAWLIPAKAEDAQRFVAGRPIRQPPDATSDPPPKGMEMRAAVLTWVRTWPDDNLKPHDWSVRDGGRAACIYAEGSDGLYSGRWCWTVSGDSRIDSGLVESREAAMAAAEETWIKAFGRPES